MYKLELYLVNLSSLVREVLVPKNPLVKEEVQINQSTTTGKKPQPETQPRTQKPEDEKSDGDMKNGETITLTFGRFNPPTVGHEKLLQGVKGVAGGGELRIYPSRSEDPQKNPLDPDTKTNMMKKMFPDFEENIVNDGDVKTIFDALKIMQTKKGTVMFRS